MAENASYHPNSRAVSLPGGKDFLAVESPLLLDCGTNKLITLRSPGLEKEWALGFLFSEGLIQTPADISAIRFLPRGGENSSEIDSVIVEFKKEPGAEGLRKLSRAHEIRASCGLCGAEDVKNLLANLPTFAPDGPKVGKTSLHKMLADMLSKQPLFDLTGGCHAAALFDAASGNCLASAEDIGRHNALDKVLGTALMGGTDFSNSVVLLSGRSGYELAVKALRAGIPIIASVSAPSTFSHELCQNAGATLIGFLREGNMKVYCGEGRIDSL